MRSPKAMIASIALFVVLIVAPVVSGCDGSDATTTIPPSGTTATSVGTGTNTPAATGPVSTDATTGPTAYDVLEAIRATLAASGQIADGFEITDSRIVDDSWAGVIVSAPNVDDARVLLERRGEIWRMVTLGSELPRKGLIEMGAPPEIADFLGYPTDMGALSDTAIAYAAELGGTSHLGETLYLIVGASAPTEADAQSLLDDATPLFGDMQSYFIVQRSDNFQGLDPGWFVLVEAYRNAPPEENLEFGRRAFPDLYVQTVTAQTSDPIPVFEDLVSE